MRIEIGDKISFGDDEVNFNCKVTEHCLLSDKEVNDIKNILDGYDEDFDFDGCIFLNSKDGEA